MKKLYYLIILTVILGLVLTGCSLLSNISQVPATEQSGIAYLTKSPSPSLVALWHFDENTGTTTSDSSASGNTGTLVNGPQWVSGKFDNALSFDGMNDYVDCAKNGDITTAITIEAWINPSAFTNYDAIVTNFEWPTNPEGWSFRVMGDGKLVWRAVLSGNNTYSITSTSGNEMVTGNWYHVVLTHDAIYTRLYINGSLDKEETPGGTIVNLGKALKIGWDDYAVDRVFNGIIDEVRIWDEVLTADQIGDISPPVVTINAPDNGGFYSVGAVPAPNYTVVDANSYTVVETGYSTDEGIHTYTVTATDVLGYVGSASVTYYVLENFVTGGGKIGKSTLGLPGKGAALTFAGTIGVLEGEGIVGQFQIVDHTGLIYEGKGAVSWHCNNFTYLEFTGSPAESPEATHDTAIFEGVFVSNRGDTQTLKFQIIDNGEPGAGVDTFSIWFFDDWLGWTIDGGNFQVHDIE